MSGQEITVEPVLHLRRAENGAESASLELVGADGGVLASVVIPPMCIQDVEIHSVEPNYRLSQPDDDPSVDRYVTATLKLSIKVTSTLYMSWDTNELTYHADVPAQEFPGGGYKD